jgi:simple sugar transport system substrate-binding protein/basic membrane protein A
MMQRQTPPATAAEPKEVLAMVTQQKQTRMKYRLTFTGLAMAAFGLAVAAQPAMAQTKVAMLLPGSINDQSWNAQGYAGLMKIKDSGYQVAYSENVPAADHVEAMRDYARQGYKIVIGHSGRFLSAAQRVGPEFPEVQFVAGAGGGGLGKNVMSIDYDNTHFGCQLGVLAARMSKTGKIAGVYALEGLPNMVAQVGSYRLCAKRIKPDIEVSIIYIKDIEDAAAAKEAAFSLIAGGADFVAGKLNAAQAGLIQAAKEKNVFTTGRSFGHTAIAPENVITNVVEKWADMYAATADSVKAGKLSGDLVMYGYNTPATSGAALQQTAERPYHPAVPATVVAELDTYKKMFATGEMKLAPTKDDARGGK